MPLNSAGSLASIPTWKNPQTVAVTEARDRHAKHPPWEEAEREAACQRPQGGSDWTAKNEQDVPGSREDYC